jgi:ATP-dependent Clp protease ATP-binding subunit ClpB
MGKIVAIQFKRLEAMIAERKISLTLSEKAQQFLAAKGYDPAYGARPLKRVMQKELQDSLAEMILSGKLREGDKLNIDAEGERLVFTPQSV